MKKFSFPLDRVLVWRRLEFDREQSLLQRALFERNSMVAREAAVRQYRLDSERLLSANASIDATLVSTLADWQSSIKRSISSLATGIIAADQKVAAHQTRFYEAKRRVGLLERLREQRVDNWKAELDREEEAFATEAFLARSRRL